MAGFATLCKPAYANNSQAIDIYERVETRGVHQEWSNSENAFQGENLPPFSAMTGNEGIAYQVRMYG